MAKEKYFFVFPDGDSYRVFPREANTLAHAIEALTKELPEYFQFEESKVYTIKIERDTSEERK